MSVQGVFEIHFLPRVVFEGRSMSVQWVFKECSKFTLYTAVCPALFKRCSRIVQKCSKFISQRWRFAPKLFSNFGLDFGYSALRADEDRTTKNVDSAFVVTSA